jgi:hypothetical protein
MSQCKFVPLSSYDFSMGRKGPWEWNPTVYSFIAAVSAVAIFMSIDLSLYSVFRTKKRESHYFWAINITAWGVALQTIAFILLIFVPECSPIFSVFLAKIGWISNVTGFAFVLYLRLHLVLRNRRLLQIILAWIIIDGVVFHLTTAVFEFGMVTSDHPDPWIARLSIIERISVIMFSLQEAFISAIYIWKTTNFVKDTYSSKTRSVLLLLIAAQAFVFLSDITMIVLDYADYFYIKVIIHPFIYGLKLKIEFVFLNQLVALVKTGMGGHSFPRHYSGDRRSPAPSASLKQDSRGRIVPKKQWEMQKMSDAHLPPVPPNSAITRAPNDGDVASQASLVIRGSSLCQPLDEHIDRTVR